MTSAGAFRPARTYVLSDPPPLPELTPPPPPRSSRAGMVEQRPGEKSQHGDRPNLI